MTNQNENQQPQQSQTRQPDYIAYHVQQSEQNGKGYFHQVGAAWQHRDGKGFDVQLESMPVNGRVCLREQRQERMQQYNNQRQDMAEQGQSMTQNQEKGRDR